MREYKDLKLSALINALMAAQAELEKFNYSFADEGNNKALAFHGNIKMTNIFVEYCGQNNNYAPNIVFSDRASIMGPSDDNKSLANIIHELVSGTKINKLPGGKPLYHFKVKNTKWFKYIQQLIAKSEQFQIEQPKVL